MKLKNFKKYLTKFDSKFLFTSEGYNLRLTEPKQQ